jgi:hypothetical protein
MNLQDGECLAQLRTTEEGVCCIVLVGWFVLIVQWKEGVDNKVIK